MDSTKTILKDALQTARYRIVAANVLSKQSEKEHAVILSTGIGKPKLVAKSTLLLALALQEREKKTLLIDCDSGNGLVRLLGVAETPGFSDPGDFAASITSIEENVYFLPYGKNGGGYMASDEAKARLARLRGEYDIVLLCAPAKAAPVALLRDACDSALLTEKRFVSRYSEMRAMIRENRLRDMLLGVILWD